MTLRMNPDVFQFGVSGWVTPLLFVQRTITVYLPGDGSVICVSHCRTPYLPSSFPSCVACQLLAPSIEISSFATPQSPPNAMPRTGVGLPAGKLVPALRFVTKERGTMRLIGIIFTFVSPGVMLACGVSGIV